MARPKSNPDLDETAETTFVPMPSNEARVPRPGQRDQTLVECLVLVHNVPVGIVLDPVRDEFGDIVYGEDGQAKTEMKERRLQFKERVKMPKWVVEVMEAREHVVTL